MGLFNKLASGLMEKLSPTQTTRIDLHSEGLVNLSSSAIDSYRQSLEETVDYVDEKLPGGTGKALGAAGAILAVGAGLALSEVVLVGAGAYFIGKKMGQVGARIWREEAHKTLHEADGGE